MLTFHAVGDWRPGHVRLGWADRPCRRTVPQVERIIDDTWARVLSRPGVHLFDGPMCRMESFNASGGVLALTVSHTSYKRFVGTNLENPCLANRFGPGVMANPVGVAALLETADGFLMLGRRNAAEAYYPGRVHPFAGALEPRDGDDPFAAVYRELHEELSLAREDLTNPRCCGLVEAHALRQPELIFLASSRLTGSDVEIRVDRAEHHAVWRVAADPTAGRACAAGPGPHAGSIRFDAVCGATSVRRYVVRGYCRLLLALLRRVRSRRRSKWRGTPLRRWPLPVATSGDGTSPTRSSDGGPLDSTW